MIEIIDLVDKLINEGIIYDIEIKNKIRYDLFRPKKYSSNEIRLKISKKHNYIAIQQYINNSKWCYIKAIDVYNENELSELRFTLEVVIENMIKNKNIILKV